MKYTIYFGTTRQLLGTDLRARALDTLLNISTKLGHHPENVWQKVDVWHVGQVKGQKELVYWRRDTPIVLY